MKINNELVKIVLDTYDLDEEKLNEIFNEPVLSNPYEAKGILECGRILKKVKDEKEKILVCGDYDADGICATTILVMALKKAGIECGYYIPDRLTEGYGLNVNTVNNALAKGYKYFITVDNGVKAVEAMQAIRAANATLILTDHHNYDESEILCDCFVHPFKMDSKFQTLSGAGVACLIARMLMKESREAVILACVAAIADCMPVWGETRSLIRLGLKYLNQGCYPAVNRLKNNQFERCDETTIGFQIAPKLNVTGRLADRAKANNTVRYLLSNDERLIDSGVVQINELNEIRKQITMEMVSISERQLSEAFFQIVHDDTFHEGVVGLVAGRLANQLNKPFMVLAHKDGLYKGSIRSVEGLDLTTFFDGCLDLLEAYGGHAMAAGISFKEEAYEEVCHYIEENSHDFVYEKPVLNTIKVDETMLTLENIDALNCLRPFGTGFEAPIFEVKVQIKEVKTMGGNAHLKIISQLNNEYILFNEGAGAEQYRQCTEVGFMGNVSINSFRGRRTVSMNVMESVFS